MARQHRKITSYLVFEIKTPTSSPVLIKEHRDSKYASAFREHMQGKNPTRQYEVRTFEWMYSVETPETV